jgi:RHS repeat-associated protein
MQMPERNFSSNKYRYGFNGKENDKDISEGDLDFGARIYDSRLGRWLALDPLMKKYPNESHYAYVADNPLIYMDKDGRDKTITLIVITSTGPHTLLKATYPNEFKYEAHACMNGGYAYYKYDVNTTYTLDLTKNTTAASLFTMQYSDIAHPIGAREYISGKTGLNKVSNWWNSINTKPTINEFGFVLTGNKNGTSLELENTRAKTKEVIDMGEMLEAFGGFKDIANFDDVPNLLDVAKDLNKSFGSGSKIVSKLLGAAEVVEKGIENGEKIVEKVETLTGKKKTNDTTQCDVENGCGKLHVKDSAGKESNQVIPPKNKKIADYPKVKS